MYHKTVPRKHMHTHATAASTCLQDGERIRTMMMGTGMDSEAKMTTMATSTSLLQAAACRVETSKSQSEDRERLQ